jgi:hypothetical protein
MATAQVFCKICQSRVSTDTILTNDDLRRALGSDEDIRVMHHRHAKADRLPPLEKKNLVAG